MRKYFVIVSSLVILIFTFTGCSTVASLIDIGLFDSNSSSSREEKTAESIINAAGAISKAAEDITPEHEYYIGRAVAASIFGRYETYDSPKLELYLNKICRVVTENSDKPLLYKGYYVKVLDSDEINAFATSGGHILVTKGLLKCVSSEDAIAAVLSHEIAHIHLQHSIKAIKANRTTNALSSTAFATLNVLTSSELSDLTSAFDSVVSDAVSSLVDSGYSKKQEYEADKLALRLMADAGYDPYAMNDMLELLAQQQKGVLGGFSKTHPTPALRISNLKNEYSNYNVVYTQESRVKRFTSIMSDL